MLGSPLRPLTTSICSQCLHTFARSVPHGGRIKYSQRTTWRSSFFISNLAARTSKPFAIRFASQDSRSQSTTASNASQPQEADQRDIQTSGRPEEIIPPDASSQLTTLSKSLPAKSLRRTFAAYLSLTKPRLTFLMVLTTTAAYSIYPVSTLLSPNALDTPSLSTVTLLFLTSGTFLTAASANAFNMYLEPGYDAQMSRTRNRPLVRGLLTHRAALIFAIATGVIGSAALYYGVNPTTAALGAGNIILYAAVYTPLKRIHPINTWVGAIVGAIPPLMGWAAAAGQMASDTGDWRELLLGPDAAGGWALAGLLFLWQIPHFAGLSFSIRHEYAAAGYKMLASSRPKLDAILSLACAALLPLCTAELRSSGIIENWANTAIIPANVWMIWTSFQFWRLGGREATARKLFWASVWYLPIVLVICMVGKTGLTHRVGGWITGETRDELEDYYEWEDEEEVVASDTPKSSLEPRR